MSAVLSGGEGAEMAVHSLNSIEVQADIKDHHE